MKKIAEGDLLRRIRLNRKRLSAKMYRYPDIFNKKYSASWPGDWEGRCILSLTSLYFALSGYDKDQESILNQLDEIISHLKEYINEDGYFGNIVNDEYLDEQQVSGNSWYLRGLIEYYQISRSDEILSLIKSVVNKFIYKIAKFYEHYPISTREIGGVGGHIEGVIRDGWLTSSDVGCAFIMLDAMSEAYYLLRDDKLKEILIKVIDKFINLDFINLKCQTHATLSCARGVLTFYEATKEEKYLNYAIDIFKKYINYGMTLDYSNINWFNRKDTWTEPCCIVDSFILTSKFYQITKDDKYLLLLNRDSITGRVERLFSELLTKEDSAYMKNIYTKSIRLGHNDGFLYFYNDKYEEMSISIVDTINAVVDGVIDNTLFNVNKFKDIKKRDDIICFIHKLVEKIDEVKKEIEECIN